MATTKISFKDSLARMKARQGQKTEDATPVAVAEEKTPAARPTVLKPVETARDPLAAFAPRTRTAIRLASEVLAIGTDWLLAEHASFRRPAVPVRVIVVHENADLEAIGILWMILSHEALRRYFNIHPDVKILVIPSGSLRAKDFREVRPEDLDAPTLERRGYLFIDCGGGGAMLDQHGRHENAQGSQVTSIDRFVAAILPHLDDFDYLLGFVEVIAAQDRAATAVATGANIKSLIDAWNAMRVEDQGFGFEEFLGHVFMAFDAAEAYLAERGGAMATSGDEGEETLRWALERRREAFRLENILGHLPAAMVPASALTMVRGRVDAYAAALAAHGTVLPETVREAMFDRCLDRELARIDAWQLQTARFRERAAEASAFRKLRRDQAREEWRTASPRVATLRDLVFQQKQSDERAADPWRTVTGQVYVVGIVSDLDQIGPHSRYEMNKREKDRLGKTLELEARHRGVADESAVSGIREAVQAAKASVVTVQFRRVERDARGDIVRLQFTISTAGVSLTHVAEEVRKELLRAYGKQPLPAHALRASGHLTIRSQGKDLDIDYFPEFRTAYGTHFRTNQHLPHAPIDPDRLWDAVLRGLKKGSGLLKAEAARNGVTPVSLDEEHLARAFG